MTRCQPSLLTSYKHTSHLDIDISLILRDISISRHLYHVVSWLVDEKIEECEREEVWGLVGSTTLV
ncbi:hypothetical protein J6590_097239 [Homalodisca vitripennis]|nr:hypothetical protein J6590_097239 [Homalodisca vitripennis]